MKFSNLEKKIIRGLCSWKRVADDFGATRSFLSQYGLKKGTGIFAFSNELPNRPSTILCINIEQIKEEEYESIINNTLFVLYFLRKLERLGLVTISEGKYDSDKEYMLGVFKGARVITTVNKNTESTDYAFYYIDDETQEQIYSHLVIGSSSCDLKEKKNDPLQEKALPYHCMNLFCRFEVFDLVSSMIAVSQDLLELANNDFKTHEEIMLDVAQKQLKKSNWALSLAVLSIIVSLLVSSFCPIKIKSTQYKEIKDSQADRLEILNNIIDINTQSDSILTDISKQVDSITTVVKGLNKKSKTNP